MTGVFLAAAWSVAVALVTVALWRAPSVMHRFRTLCWVALAGLAGWLVSWVALPAAWRHADGTVGLANGVYLYVFLCFGVLAQVYALADRGFSLAIVSGLLAAGPQGRTREEIKAAYAGGRGMGFVREKRIQQIVSGGLIRRVDGAYETTRLGAWVAAVMSASQRLYGFTETG